MKLQRNQHLPSEIPTSSMADIAFLLIVFFMVTTVFSANKGMEHIMPPEVSDGKPEDAIFIKIMPDGYFQMDRQTYTMREADQVYDYVSRRVQINGQKPVLLWANGEAPYGNMVRIMDVLKQLEADLPNYSMPLTLATKSDISRFPHDLR